MYLLKTDLVRVKEVRVYVNKSDQPSLTIEKLNAREDGLLVFWALNDADGDYANLVITKIE